jgi:hypothetical protein
VRHPLFRITLTKLRHNELRSHYDKAIEACKRVNKNLRQLNLSAEDQNLIEGCDGSLIVTARIRDLQRVIEAKAKGKRAKRTVDLANTFCEIAARVCPIAQVMVPQSLEYTLPFGCLALLFKVSRSAWQASCAN